MVFRQKSKEEDKFLTVAWDLGSDFARLITLKRKGEELYLDSLVSCELTPALISGSFTKSNLPEPGKLQQILGELVAKAGLKSLKDQRAALCIPDLSVRTFFYDLEAVPSNPQDAQDLLRWRAKDLLPYPAEEAVVDFQLLGVFPKEGKNLYRLFCIFLRREILWQYEDLLQSLGFYPAQVLCGSLGLYNLFVDYFCFKEGAGHSWVLVNLDQGATTIMVMDNGVLGYFRSLRDEGRVEETPASYAHIVQEVADSLHYYLTAHPASILSKIYLAGVRAARPGLPVQLAEGLNLPVEVADLKRVARVAPHIPARAETLLGAAPALGLAAYIKDKL